MQRRLGTWWDPVVYAIKIGLMGVVGVVAHESIAQAWDLQGPARVVVGVVVVFFVVAILELEIVGRPLQRTLQQSHERNVASKATLRAAAAAQEFESKLARALDMAQDEQGALDTVERALDIAARGHHVELLLADSSRAHLARAAGTGHDRACSVESPRDCVAVRRGQTLTFKDSEELDACPHLRGRAGGDCSAVCVPVNVLGNTVGVLHATSGVEEPPSKEVAAALETVSTQAGARIGMLRALHRSEIQASTDPLTGLLNRRSVEDRIHQLQREERAFAVVLADLDHFKLLNDTHGHETGDRALRLFSQVLKTSLRPGDLAARYGGEEFLLVFPDSDTHAAASAVERLREELAIAVAGGGTPPFTSSFGVADLSHGATLAEVLSAADEALLTAKREGRNRILVAAAA